MSQARRLRFTADGREYFRIWIVNVALTLLTLGIYSAWAKVRARRYLYGNVWLGDDAFDYTANPVAILRGRILVAIVLVLLWFAQIFSLLYYYAALLALMPLVPWVVVRARSFQMRNSRHRSIALDFQGRYWDAAVWYPLSWAASIATLGLARPFTVFGRDRFLVEESRFGNRPFGFTGTPRPYYGMYVVTAVVVGVLYFGGVFVVFLTMLAATSTTSSDPAGTAPDMRLFVVGLVAVVAAVGLFVLAYLRTRLLCYRWNNTRLGDDTVQPGTLLPEDAVAVRQQRRPDHHHVRPVHSLRPHSCAALRRGPVLRHPDRRRPNGLRGGRHGRASRRPARRPPASSDWRSAYERDSLSLLRRPHSSRRRDAVLALTTRGGLVIAD